MRRKSARTPVRHPALLQMVLGFSDAVTPGAVPAAYPVNLDFPAPHLSGYPMETVVAEKVKVMVKLGALKSRMKDFYDVWVLAGGSTSRVRSCYPP